MSSFVFAAFKNKLVSTSYNFYANEYKIALVNTTFKDSSVYDSLRLNKTLDMTNAAMQSCIVTGTNLDPISLTNVYISTTLPFTVKADDVLWQLVTVEDVVGAVVYDNSGVPISFIDFVTTRIATNGTISVPLSNGFLQIP